MLPNPEGKWTFSQISTNSAQISFVQVALDSYDQQPFDIILELRVNLPLILTFFLNVHIFLPYYFYFVKIQLVQLHTYSTTVAIINHHHYPKSWAGFSPPPPHLSAWSIELGVAHQSVFFLGPFYFVLCF